MNNNSVTVAARYCAIVCFLLTSMVVSNFYSNASAAEKVSDRFSFPITLGGLSCGEAFGLQANLILSGSNTSWDSGKFRTHIVLKGDLVDESGEKVGTVAGTSTFNQNIGGLPTTFEQTLVATCQGSGIKVFGPTMLNFHLGATVDENGKVHLNSISIPNNL